MTAPKAPASQIAIMSGVIPATVQPVSQFARFVHGDIKGKDAMQSFRMTMVHTAILESFKGNLRNLKEAADLTEGKSKKARAWAAGFAAVLTTPLYDADGQPVAFDRLAYTGKWDAKDNAAVRDAAHGYADALAGRFESAFAAVIAEPKKTAAPKPETAPAPTEAPATEAAAPEGETIEAGFLVSTVVDAIGSGMLLADELAALRAALASYDAAHDIQPAGLLPVAAEATATAH